MQAFFETRLEFCQAHPPIGGNAHGRRHFAAQALNLDLQLKPRAPQAERVDVIIEAIKFAHGSQHPDARHEATEAEKEFKALAVKPE